jgi:hypothetical protein
VLDDPAAVAMVDDFAAGGEEGLAERVQGWVVDSRWGGWGFDAADSELLAVSLSK